MSAPVQIHGTTRQVFLLRATLAAAATFGAASATPYVRRAIAQESGTDADILNFALTLEHLEATFYALALERVDGLSEDETKLVRRLRDDERAHVEILSETITQLGAVPVEEPTFDFGSALSDRAAFFKASNTFEDTGVSAYNGAAPSIQNKEILAAAGSIVQVEGRHAALVRLVRNQPPAPVSFDKASRMPEVLRAVRPFIRSSS